MLIAIYHFLVKIHLTCNHKLCGDFEKIIIMKSICKIKEGRCKFFLWSFTSFNKAIRIHWNAILLRQRQCSTNYQERKDNLETTENTTGGSRDNVHHLLRSRPDLLPVNDGKKAKIKREKLRGETKTRLWQLDYNAGYFSPGAPGGSPPSPPDSWK